MQQILNDLADMFPDTMTVTPITKDGFGKVIASGTAFPVKVKLSNSEAQVMSEGVGLVTSNLQAIVLGAYNLTTDKHRYTLPSRFSPREPKPVSIGRRSDENGAHHETVFF